MAQSATGHEIVAGSTGSCPSAHSLGIIKCTVANRKHMNQGDIAAARERVGRIVRRHMARGRYRLNPDSATVENVLAGLAQNLAIHGRCYCPCREVTGDPERDRANLCPCPQHHADIARDGFCECGIFVSQGYAAAHSAASTTRHEKEV